MKRDGAGKESRTVEEEGPGETRTAVIVPWWLGSKHFHTIRSLAGSPPRVWNLGCVSSVKRGFALSSEMVADQESRSSPSQLSSAQRYLECPPLRTGMLAAVAHSRMGSRVAAIGPQACASFNQCPGHLNVLFTTH